MKTLSQEQFIEVGIGNERYALRIHEINEIIKMQDITAIPGSKAYMMGVINLRGKIVPVISLRSRFGLPEEPGTKSTCIVVVNFADEMVGIAVDRVNRVTTLADVQPASERAGGAQGSFFAGIGRTEAGLVSLLKLDQVLGEQG